MEEEEEQESPDLIQHIFTEQKQDGSQVSSSPLHKSCKTGKSSLNT